MLLDDESIWSSGIIRPDPSALSGHYESNAKLPSLSPSSSRSRAKHYPLAAWNRYFVHFCVLHLLASSLWAVRVRRFTIADSGFIIIIILIYHAAVQYIHLDSSR